MSTPSVSNSLITISFCASYTFLETPYILFFFVHRLSEMSIFKLRALNKLKALGTYVGFLFANYLARYGLQRGYGEAAPSGLPTSLKILPQYLRYRETSMLIF